MDPFKIITGSSTGSIKVFDITTSQLLQNLSLRRGAEVGDIHNAGGALDNRSEWRLIAIANGSIRSWDFRPNSGAGASVSSTGGKAKRRAARNRFDATRAGARANGSVISSSSSLASRMISPKGQLNLDMRSEMRDYEIEQRQERKLESRREKERLKMQGRVNGTEVSGLSEEELLNYAMMLSMEQSHASLPSASSPDAFIPLDEAEAVAIAESLSLASLPPSAPSPSLSASPASLSSSLPNDLPNFSFRLPFQRHHVITHLQRHGTRMIGISTVMLTLTRGPPKHLLANDAPVSSKRHSLTIPIGGSTPTAALSSTPPFSTPLSYAAVAHRRTLGSSSSSTSSLNEWSDDEGEPESATPSGRRFVFGTIGGGNAPMVLRSPRLGPGVGTHVSPRLGPGSGVVVAPRRTERDEEEEMMYVLELSLLEK
ncbi:hypothetical protein BC829DRAFT_384812 [Chytridium lagenaria]|nr:hypothetical protein BC829DRAFT_384812 [Chytridium lagenaria]